MFASELSSQSFLSDISDLLYICEENYIHNEIGDHQLTEGAVCFRRGGIVLQDATGPPLGTTQGRPYGGPPSPFHQVFMCCL